MDGDWGIALVSSLSSGDIFVTDILDDVPVGDPQPAVYDPNLDCGPGLEHEPEGMYVEYYVILLTLQITAFSCHNNVYLVYYGFYMVYHWYVCSFIA